MSVVTWIHEFNAAPAGALPRNVFRYVLGTSGLHQLFLLALTVSVFLLEVVPLELQRRIVNNLVKHRPFSWVVSLCAVYAGIVLVQGGTKLALNIYRGWVGERAKRELRFLRSWHDVRYADREPLSPGQIEKRHAAMKELIKNLLAKKET